MNYKSTKRLAFEKTKDFGDLERKIKLITK